MSLRFPVGRFALASVLVLLAGACDTPSAPNNENLGAALGSATIVHRGGRDLLQFSADTARTLGFAVVQQIGLPGKLEANGQVAFDDRRVANIISRVSGRIEDVRVSQWDYVRRGQPIFTLYSPDFMTAEAEYLQAKAALSALASGGPDSMNFAHSMLEAARHKLELLGLSDAQIDAIKTAAPSFLMQAPISGNIVQNQALRGSAVNPGDVLYSVGTLDDVWIMAAIYEDDLARVQAGQPLEAVTTAYPGEVFHGVVDRISPNIDPNTHTLQLRAAVQNPGLKLKPQMLARVKIAVRAGEVLAVPRDALVFETDGYFAYVDAGNDSVERRAVVTGTWEQEGVARVVSGLHPGDRVVTGAALQVDQLWHEARGDKS